MSNSFDSVYGRDPRVDPDAGPANPDRKFPDPAYDHGKLLDDHAKYYSREHWHKEWSRMWCRVWNLAGRTSDVAKVGDWFKFDLGPESFIIVRSAPDRIQAFYNVCHHRGSRIVHQDFGSATSFVCGFHSWAWNIDGSLKRITDRESFDEALICDNPGLTEVRCEIWGGFVFINMDENAEPLVSFLDVLPDELEAYNFDDMMMLKDASVEWPVNWKVGLDAFLEGYHAHSRHPELMNYIDDYHFQHDLWGKGHSRMIIPMGDKTPRFKDQKKLTAEQAFLLTEVGLDPAEFEGRSGEVRAAIQARKPEWAAEFGMDYSRFTPSQLSDDWNFSIFPNITLNIHPEGALVMKFRPHPTDPEICYYDVWVIGHKVKSSDFKMPAYMTVDDSVDLTGDVPRPDRIYGRHGEMSMGQVLDQDGDFLPLVQQGVKSQAYRGVRLSKQEVRLRHLYAEYDRWLEGASQ